MQSDLIAKLQPLARTPHLLVACDYDGTLANIVADPFRAAPDPRALAALRALAEVYRTTTAVVSGRSLSDLDAFLGAAGLELRIGSHGAEWGTTGVRLTRHQRELLTTLAGLVASAAQKGDGLRCEFKPAAVALHTRTADPTLAESAVAQAVASLGSLPGVHVRHGSEVVEFMVVPANKGEAVLRIKAAIGATGVLFLGDDLTDEDVFRVLEGDDVGLKVGAGHTLAGHRIADVTAVAEVLETVAMLRHARKHSRGAS